MKRLALVLAAVATLAGCVSVPISGPVESHSAQPQQANPGVEIAPVPPASGASPGLIVEGFLHAMATYQRDYAVARQFLTTEANRGWQPQDGVEIYAEGYPPVVNDTSAVLTAPLVGSLDARGVLKGESTTYHHDFGLVQDAQGQWRISHPPDGLLVSEYLFTSTFARIDLCFWDRDGTRLVPDPRYFPKGQRELTAAVGAVLAGPSPWLVPITREPLATTLEADSVALSQAGVVTVQLHQEGLPSSEVRQQVLTELAWSVADIDGVTGVRVRSGTQSWPHGSDDVATAQDFVHAGPVNPDPPAQLYALVGGGVARVSESTTNQLVPIAPSLTKVNSFAVRRDGQQVAAVTDNRTRLRSAPVGEGTAKVELTGRGLLRPQYSRFGELWVASDQVAEPRLSVLIDGRPVAVNLDGVPAGGIRAMRLAPDGVRIVLIIEAQRSGRLGLARVVRGSQGITVEGWQDIVEASTASATGPSQLLDVAWSGASRLLVLTSTQQVTQVLSVDSDGMESHEIGPGETSTLQQLTMNPGLPGLALSSEGTVYRLYGEFTWGLLLSGVQGLNYPDGG